MTTAKADFSNSRNTLQQKWAAYVKGDPKRQEVLEVALKWIAASKDMSIDRYMADHRHDKDIVELMGYFTSVIDWIGSVFSRSPDKEMRGLEWGRLYEEHHSKPYNATAIEAKLVDLRSDPAVHNSKGIYEFLLGVEKQTQLLDVRLFDDKTTRHVYQQQTSAARAAGKSNCPLRAVGHSDWPCGGGVSKVIF